MIKQENGFTLLEVMIAVAIMAIALVSLLHLIVLNIGYAQQDKIITMATFFARQKIVEGLALTEGQRDGEGEGEDEFQIFSWKRTVMPTVFNKISEMKVIITWKENDEERELSVMQYIFDG